MRVLHIPAAQQVVVELVAQALEVVASPAVGNGKVAVGVAAQK